MLGIDPASIPAPPAEEDGLWPCHEAAMRAFLAVSRQWRTATAGMGGVRYVGLDYTAVRAGLDLAGIEIDPETWAQVRVIEVGALGALNEERS